MNKINVFLLSLFLFILTNINGAALQPLQPQQQKKGSHPLVEAVSNINSAEVERLLKLSDIDPKTLDEAKKKATEELKKQKQIITSLDSFKKSKENEKKQEKQKYVKRFESKRLLLDEVIEEAENNKTDAEKNVMEFQYILNLLNGYQKYNIDLLQARLKPMQIDELHEFLEKHNTIIFDTKRLSNLSANDKLNLLDLLFKILNHANYGRDKNQDESTKNALENIKSDIQRILKTSSKLVQAIYNDLEKIRSIGLEYLLYKYLYENLNDSDKLKLSTVEDIKQFFRNLKLERLK